VYASKITQSPGSSSTQTAASPVQPTGADSEERAQETPSTAQTSQLAGSVASTVIADNIQYVTQMDTYMPYRIYI